MTYQILRTNFLFFFFLLPSLPIYCKAYNYNFSETRSNFCPIHKLLELKKINLRDALEGFHVNVALDEDYLDESNADISLMIFQELARRAKLNYTLHGSPKPTENETWTDALMRRVNKYDLVLGYNDMIIERLSLGVIFPEPWFNGDTILLAREAPEEDVFIFWAFIKPFSTSLWILLMFTIGINGIIFVILEFLYLGSRKRKATVCFEDALFSSFYSFMGTRSVYKPESTSTRVFTISMTFLYLILVSAYIANLTNYFVIKSRPKPMITDINDAIRKNQVICGPKGYASYERIKRKYPGVKLYSGVTERDSVTAVSEGKCDLAAVSIGSFTRYSRDAEYNKHCDLSWVGRRVLTADSGYAIKDSQELCSSLLESVLNYHMLQMKLDGAIESLTKSFEEREIADSCEVKIKRKENKKNTLTVLNLGGVLAFYLFLAFFSFIVASYEFYSGKKQRANQNTSSKKCSQITSSSHTKTTQSSSLHSPKQRRREEFLKVLIEKVENENKKLKDLLRFQDVVDEEIHREISFIVKELNQQR